MELEGLTSDTRARHQHLLWLAPYHACTPTVLWGTPKPKVSAVNRFQEDRDLLHIVLSYLGPGQHLFVATIGKRWRRAYNSTAISQGWHSTEPYVKTRTSSACFSLARLKYAVQGGKLDMLSKSKTSTEHSFARTMGFNASQELLQWARANGMPWYDDVAIGAAAAGKLESLKWIHKQVLFGWSWPAYLSSGKVALVAAMYGQVAVLEWMWMSRGGSFLKDLDIGEVAAVTGKVPTLHWMQGRCLSAQKLQRIRDNAAFFTQPGVLLWARDEGGVAWDASTFTAATTSGSVDFCRWLRKEGCAFDLTDACVGAAFSGSIDMIKYVREIAGQEWSLEHVGMIMLAAGYEGRLRAFKWAHAQGAPWLPAAFTAEQDGTHFCRVWRAPVLQWAIGHGCPWGDWTSQTCALLKQSGNFDKELAWAHANNCPCGCPR
ncbi:hypothetical protein JKP88DRAFT_347896 [Tribonema minus]|uniref:Uncharacterized protein n=1 Tax=Tribonema minus TaxID=303371 RepID=A0A836CLN2_9STRA|nr:hypothetical protein JKP88DRAFT_347896 [Tribonema minus]